MYGVFLASASHLRASYVVLLLIGGLVTKLQREDWTVSKSLFNLLLVLLRYAIPKAAFCCLHVERMCTMSTSQDVGNDEQVLETECPVPLDPPSDCSKVTEDGGVLKHVLSEGSGEVPVLHGRCLGASCSQQAI